MKLYLIGLPGSGKSYLGKKLAEEAQIPFIDLDKTIEQNTGDSINAIFSNKGEAYFRNLEAAALRQQSKILDFVMACGGGTPCYHDNMKFIVDNGTSIFLDIPMAEIVSRLDSVEKDNRPLLSGEHTTLENKLRTLLERRISFYNQATIRVNKAISPTELLTLIKS